MPAVLLIMVDRLFEGAVTVLLRAWAVEPAVLPVAVLLRVCPADACGLACVLVED